MDSKSVKCILLGYGDKVNGYRLYDLTKKKVFLSRYVVFNERERSSSQRSCENLVNDQVELGNHDVTNVESQPEGDRPQRIRKPPKMYGEWSNLYVQDVPESEAFTEALRCKDASLWQEAMQNDLNSRKQCLGSGRSS